MANMKRLAYREANYGTLSVSGTSEATATEIVSLPELELDGSTQIMVEFFTLAWGATTGFDCVMVLFDGDTPLGEIFRAQSWSSPGGSSGSMFFRVLTPSAGVHRYNVRAWFESGGSFGFSGDKATEGSSPVFIRAYALTGAGTDAGSSAGTKVECGFFQPSNVVEETTITLADEDFGDVKLLLLFTVAQATPEDTDGDAIMSVGIATDRGGTASQYCASMFSDDGVGTSATAIGGNTGSIARTYSTGTPTVDFDMALVSLGDAQFRVSVTDLPTTPGIRIYYKAIGGDAVTDALVGTYSQPSGTGDQDVTVVAGFGLPDLLLSLIGHPPGGDAGANIRFQIGAGKDDTEMAVTSFNQDDGTNNMELSSYQDDVFIAVPNNDTAMAQVATLAARAGWPTDGFRINKSVAALSLTVMAYAALKGTFTSKIGLGTAPTAGTPPVTDDIELGATPKGALFFHNVLPATVGQDNNDADQGAVGIGMTDGVRTYWLGIGNDDGNTTSIAHRNASEDKAIRMLTPSATGTLASEADASIVGTAVRLSWGDIDTLARQYGYMILGDAPASPFIPQALIF